MRFVAAIAVSLLLALGSVWALGATGARGESLTSVRLIEYRAHDGRRRRAWLLVPADYGGEPIPLVISPHGRGCDAIANARLWGNLPAVGDFAVINPLGQGRRIELYSWGDPGQIADLVRMPEIVERHGVRVDPRRIYAFGGSMGGMEALLMLARQPRLLAGVAAFDPATDMARRYRDFAALPDGRELQSLAREEIGGTPQRDPGAYARRSPDASTRRIADSGVPLQLFWSAHDRVIADQKLETGALYRAIRRLNPSAPVSGVEGEWAHTAEMRPGRLLPLALARFGLLPPSLVGRAPRGRSSATR